MTVEARLGRPVSQEEIVSVKAIAPGAIVASNLSPEQRKRALEGLQEYFQKVDGSRKTVSDVEEEAIFAEAIRTVRPNYRPID